MIPLSQPVEEWSLARLVVAGTLLCAVPMFLVVALMGLILTGRVSFDYLLTGTVCLAVIGAPTLALLGHLLREIARQRQEHLSASLDRADGCLRAALESIDEGIAMVGRGGEVLMLNQRIIELWGIPPGQAGLCNQSCLVDHVCAQLRDPETFRTLIGRLPQAGTESNENLRLKDGRVFSFQARALHIDRDWGRLFCFQDVSLHQRLVEAEYQRALLDHFPFMVWIKDEQSRFLAVNQVFSDNVGWPSPQSLIGKSDLDLFPADLADPYRSYDRAVLEKGQPISVEEPIEIGGVRRWYETYKTPVRIDGRVIGTVGYARDITDRKRTEHRMSLAVEVTQIVFGELEVATGRLSYDPAMLPILGLEPDTTLDSVGAWVARMHPDDRPRMRREMVRMRRPGDPILDVEYRIANRAGQYQWIQTRGRIVERGADGIPLLMVGTSMNTTARKASEEAHRLSETRARDLAAMLRLLCDNVPDMIWAKDLENRYLFANTAICEQLLCTSDTEEPVGKGDRFFGDRARATHPDNPLWHTFDTTCGDSDADTLRRNAPTAFEESGHVKGQLTFLAVHKAPFVDTNGVVIGTVGSARDITERKQAEEQLHLAASVFTHAREGIMITAANGDILDVNEAFTEITGHLREEVLGRNPRLLASGRHDSGFFAELWGALTEHGHWSGEIWDRRRDGEVFASMQTIGAVRDADGRPRHYVALMTDVTALKEHDHQLEQIAHYDTLTRLPNRVLFADRLHQAMVQAVRRGQQLAVAYLDLDGFKSVNDVHGHAAGDRLLEIVAERMQGELRQGDTLARLGGDEFAAVLIDFSDRNDCGPLLARLLAAVGTPVLLDDGVQRVSASIGVTFYPQGEATDAIDGDQLLRQADQAMYQAKVTGKNCYHIFDADRDRGARGHHKSIEDVRRALAEGEFTLVYQPEVNMRTGRPIRVEALIRWRSPQRGLLLPATFLPMIEDHPLSIELGDWVIEAALTQMDRWRALGLEIPVSVNVGARQLQHSDFAARLRERLAAHPDIPPSQLQLEVLETSALADLAQVSRVIEACREIGVTFAMDDFGTGYSSLTYLKRLPVELLKIDSSFVRDMLVDPEDLVIVESVLGLSLAFRREVIAEGVESLEHGEVLLRLGCDLAQGYGIARPMPPEALPDWWIGWRQPDSWVDVPVTPRKDLPLLHAGVEHRAWVASLGRCLAGDTVPKLPLDHRQCNFGRWLHTAGRASYGARPAFQAVDALHQRMHALALELLEIRRRGRAPEALARLEELHDLRSKLMERLLELMPNDRGSRRRPMVDDITPLRLTELRAVTVG